MNKLRSIYEPALGVGLVDLMERLQIFRVFSSTPFTVALFVLAVSILICTLDRTPRLWQQSASIRVVQPDAYFDPACRIGSRLRLDPASTPRCHRRASERPVLGSRDRRGGRHALPVRRPESLDEDGHADLAPRADPVPRRRPGDVEFGDEQGLVVAEGDTLRSSRSARRACCWSRTWRSMRRA